jgi:hypothetical protein
MTELSAAVLLKSDDTVGYWEYAADVRDGHWSVEFTRGEAWNPEPGVSTLKNDGGIDYQRYHLGATLRLNGELVFTTNHYEPGFPPFLSSYDVNGMMAMAMVANLAEWYRGSCAHQALGAMVDLLGGLLPRDQNGEPIKMEYMHYMTEADLELLQGQARSTSDLCRAFYLLGMQETTPEWRQEYCGTTEFEPPSWHSLDEGEADEH